AGIPLQERAEGNFGVAIGPEAMAQRFELAAQLAEIVNLAVIDDDALFAVAIDAGANRLLAAIEIDHLEPHRAQRHARGTVNALLVGTAMNDRRRHTANQRFAERRIGRRALCEA